MNSKVIAEIGETAGQVWKLLDIEGPQTMAQIKKKTGAKTGYVEYALGWLAREGKIGIEIDKRTYRVTLTEPTN